MTPQKRIKELTTLQRWFGSSMIVKLGAIKGKWFYTVTLIAETDKKKTLTVGGKYGLTLQRKKVGEMFEASIDENYVIMSGKYNGEDPEDLISQASQLVGKWTCGKQLRKPHDNSQRALR